MTEQQKKAKLWQEVVDGAAARVQSAQSALEGFQDSLGAEAKSTAGDKHETGRAMVQQEMERAVTALQQARAFLQALHAQQPAEGPPVRWGSWVELEGLHIVIAQPLGRLATHAGDVQVISPDSPLARALMQAAAGPGDSVQVNGRTLQVRQVR